jgi:hypothetical protein
LEADRARLHPTLEGAARLKTLAACAFVVVALLLAGTGCGAAPATAQTQTARGVLLDVVSPSIQQVDRFTLRTDDGQLLAFVTAPDFNAGVAHVMTPGHMRQHMALADPVIVTYRTENGTLVALSATDASS